MRSFTLNTAQPRLTQVDMEDGEVSDEENSHHSQEAQDCHQDWKDSVKNGFSK